MGSDSTIVRGLLVDYLTSARRLAVELRAAVEAKHLAKISGIAHRLKSSSRAVGALLLGDSCETLESGAKSGDWEEVARHTAEFESFLAAVDDHISKFIVAGERASQGTETRIFLAENEFR